MKILYVSVYRDGTGYANAAINNILALKAAGFDVVCRPITLTPKKQDECVVEELEKKDSRGIDLVIQHILPNYFVYKAGVKNIGCFSWETDNFSRSNWPECCNLMDEVWVSCAHNVTAAINSKVKVPVFVWPISCDKNKFNQNIKPMDLGIKNKCIFYAISEASKRKNFSALIRGYFDAFSKRDDVFLIIKTHKSGEKPEETKRYLTNIINEIKNEMHSYGGIDNYPKIGVITDFMSDEQISRLHTACDVFVLPSKGEGWSIPTHDAMGFGNPVIVSNYGGFRDFVDPNLCWLVNGYSVPCFGQNGYPLLYTGAESYFDVDIKQLSYNMQDAYQMWQSGTLHNDRSKIKECAMKFSHEAIADITKGLVNGKPS